MQRAARGDSEQGDGANAGPGGLLALRDRRSKIPGEATGFRLWSHSKLRRIAAASSDLLPAGACTARWSSEPEWKGNGVATSNWRRSKLVSAHMRADRGLNRPPDEEHGPKMAVPLGCLVMVKLYGE